MFQILRRRLAKQEGFTLIELVVVIAILGLLVALALPNFLGARNRAAVAEARGIADEWKSLTWACYLEKGAVASCDTPTEVGWSQGDSVYWEWSAVTSFTTTGTTIRLDVDGLTGTLADGGTYQMTLTVSGAGAGTAADAFTI
ncbi:MAG TPA: type II secretion system protein [bacterium]|jgi:prepilin-type N-terminal cleavage/methylation domain-containing protein